METTQEILRIKVPNFSCSSIVFTHDGKAILTGKEFKTVNVKLKI